MSDDKKLIPRWRAQLWAWTMDAATGLMAVLGATVVLVALYIWVALALQGPVLLRWGLRAVAVVAALVWLGRWVDRWSEARRAPAPQSVVPTMAYGDLHVRPNQCHSERLIRGHLQRCELNLHQMDPPEGYSHQVSRPNGRWMWGPGASSVPLWCHDAHWTGEAAEPPQEPFSWREYNLRRHPHPLSPRRTDETRP